MPGSEDCLLATVVAQAERHTGSAAESAQRKADSRILFAYHLVVMYYNRIHKVPQCALQVPITETALINNKASSTEACKLSCLHWRCLH